MSRRWPIVLAALSALALAPASASAQSSEPDCDFPRRAVSGDRKGVSARAPNPLEAASQWYVDAKEPAFKSMLEYGNTPSGRQMAKIALSPRFRWFGRFTNVPRTICRFIREAETYGKVPLVATLRHQGKQCNSRYQAGGVAEDEATKRWFEDFARGIGDSRVIIAFEPDSVGTIECLARSRRSARVAVLRHGIDVLSRLPNATIYIEATAADWKPVSYVARQLRQIGVSKVRGFMLNVTHYEWTRENIRYGRKLSKRLGGKHFVISTAMNGRGSVRVPRGKRKFNVLCHPLYRGAGPVSHHQDRRPAGGRVPVDQPRRLLRRFVQRRPAAGGHVVARPRAHVRALSVAASLAPARHALRVQEGPVLRSPGGGGQLPPINLQSSVGERD